MHGKMTTAGDTYNGAIDSCEYVVGDVADTNAPRKIASIRWRDVFAITYNVHAERTQNKGWTTENARTTKVVVGGL